MQYTDYNIITQEYCKNDITYTIYRLSYCNIRVLQKSLVNHKHQNYLKIHMNWLIMIIMMMSCFCSMVDRRKAFSLICCRGHCQRSSPSRIPNTTRAGFEPNQNLCSEFVEWSYAVVTTTTPGSYFSFHPQNLVLDITCTIYTDYNIVT